MNTISNLALIISAALVVTSCSSGGDDAAPAAPVVAPIGDISGVWRVSESASSSTAGCSGFETYSLTVSQNGNAVTVTDADSNKFNGTLSGSTLTWSGSYPEPPGTTSASVSLTIGASCSTFSGNSTWSYSETGFACSGTSTATGTRTSGGSSC